MKIQCTNRYTKGPNFLDLLGSAPKSCLAFRNQKFYKLKSNFSHYGIDNHIVKSPVQFRITTIGLPIVSCNFPIGYVMPTIPITEISECDSRNPCFCNSEITLQEHKFLRRCKHSRRLLYVALLRLQQ